MYLVREAMSAEIKILITAEAFGNTRDSHARWLQLLLRMPLLSCLNEADIFYASFEEAALEAVDFVIGFELSAEAMEKIDGKGKVYIDIRIHPLRYLDDIFFSFKTNSDAIEMKLKSYALDENICRMHADLVAAMVVSMKKDRIIAPNSLLLIGQTEVDRVVFDGEKYLSLLDRIDEIREIASDYEHVYFKPHPYAKNNHNLLRKLRKALGEVRSAHDNIYHLLGNDGVKHVAALNSSVLYEAAFFNKETTFLFNPTFTDKQTGIYGDYLGGAFWSDILSPVLSTAPSSMILPFQPSRIRKTLNDFWGYNEISDEIILKDIIKNKIKRLLSQYIR